ncbi:MAG TPA: hypothetical protein VFE84_03240 [Patescibacteria group bacterium]|jgi:hypothetical protein|nr:hypothetical protein [Patescibacteria group bacterium]
MIPALLFRLAAPNPHGFLAQVPLEVLLATPGTAREAQLVLEVQRGVLGTMRSAQVVIEVLRTAGCQVAPPPPQPPGPLCPPLGSPAAVDTGCIIPLGDF